MSIELSQAKILVTGGTGFIGTWLTQELRDVGVYVHSIGGNKKRDWDVYGVDLTNPVALSGFMDRYGPFDYCLHTAGYNGGLGLNLAEPAKIFYENSLMALNIIEACRQHKVKKFVGVVASCAYPAWQWFQTYGGSGARETCPEGEFLDSPPHDSVACHGYAKRNLQLACSYYAKQYGMRAVCACPTTLFGPNDSFDLQRTKVLGALVKKFVDAADRDNKEVTLWGSGKPLREFLFVKDAAKKLVNVLKHYEQTDIPINLGSGQEHSIAQVADTIACLVPYCGKIIWDTSKPDGQYRKRLDLSREAFLLPHVELTPFEEGVRQTIAYYRALTSPAKNLQ